MLHDYKTVAAERAVLLACCYGWLDCDMPVGPAKETGELVNIDLPAGPAGDYLTPPG